MGVDPDKLVERSYDYMVHQWPEYDGYEKWIEKIAATDGPILELAAGPAGGLTPLILQKNPSATLVMSDIGFWPFAAVAVVCRPRAALAEPSLCPDRRDRYTAAR